MSRLAWQPKTGNLKFTILDSFFIKEKEFQFRKSKKTSKINEMFTTILTKLSILIIATMMVIYLHSCLLLTRNKHAPPPPSQQSIKANPFEGFLQALDTIQNCIEAYEIKEDDIALLVYMINKLNEERPRKQTVYWYSRQG